MWGNPIHFHRVKYIGKHIEKKQILTQSIEKSFLIDPLTTNNAIYIVPLILRGCSSFYEKEIIVILFVCYLKICI